MAWKANPSCSRDVKHKHQTISNKEKVELLKNLERCVSVRKLYNDQCIGWSTVYDIMKEREKALKFYAESDSKKTMKDGKRTWTFQRG